MEKYSLVIDHMIILQMSLTITITHLHFVTVGNMNAFLMVDPIIGHCLLPLHTDTNYHHRQTTRDFLLAMQVTGMMGGGQEHLPTLNMVRHYLMRFLLPCWMR